MPQRNWRESELIPPKFIDATTDQPVVAQWVSTILSGGHARMLLLGPSHSGKTHHAYAALRLLLDGGYPAGQVAFHRASQLGKDYVPALIDDGPPVIVIDDATLSLDINEGVRPEYVGVDPPDIQAIMAVDHARCADAVARLAIRPHTSWIICASGVEQMASVLGGPTTDTLTTLADTVVLTKRPLERVLDW